MHYTALAGCRASEERPAKMHSLTDFLAVAVFAFHSLRLTAEFASIVGHFYSLRDI